MRQTGRLESAALPRSITLSLAELPYAVGTVFLGQGFVEQNAWLILAVGALGLVAVTLLAASPSFVFWSRQGVFVTNVTQPLCCWCVWLGLRWADTDGADPAGRSLTAG